MYSALDLSTYIVSKCIKDHSPISNLQLQKILYYIQKEFLKNDDIAFSDDIEAWQFGPVVQMYIIDFVALVLCLLPIYQKKSIFNLMSKI